MKTDTTRKPLLALIASLFMPGLGQLYNGQATKGLVIFLALCITAPFSPVSAWFAVQSSGHHILLLMMVFVAIALAIYIYALRDAYRTAKQIDAGYTPETVNPPYIYLLAFIVGCLVYINLFHYTSEHLIQPVYVPARSMLPTVLPGDYLLIDKRVNCLGCKRQLQQGDLVIFVDPNNRTRLYIKRIIGLPNDKVVIKGTTVKVNGQPIDAGPITTFGHQELEQLLTTHVGLHERADHGEYTVIWKKNTNVKQVIFSVPNGQVFVLGDNRSASDDSRHVGTIPLSDVIGIAQQVWFSYSRINGIRWWRIGMAIGAHKTSALR